ncbi:MAG: bacillithiol system redox-active protein YtxJ [Acidobacteria bacterium]|nr:bacillithiol system redox-active protein YtxJ [Acidobacteriota bacterium]
MPPAPRLQPLTEPDMLDAWMARSHHEPVLIFKHSATCGTSAAAREEVEHFVTHTGNAPPCALVVVQTHRALSNAVAARLDVPHHSPQIFLVIDGHARWHASHWRITSQALTEAVAAARSVPV